jgi:hypothetical protein
MGFLLTLQIIGMFHCEEQYLMSMLLEKLAKRKGIGFCASSAIKIGIADEDAHGHGV